MNNTILVVEDDPELLEIFGQMLQFAKFDVLFATNGLEAIAHLERSSSEIALLITDIMMPKMGGNDLADWALMNHPHIPCIKVSGCVEAPPGAGPAEFLEKPFTEKAFLESVYLALAPTGFRIAL